MHNEPLCAIVLQFVYKSLLHSIFCYDYTICKFLLGKLNDLLV